MSLLLKCSSRRHTVRLDSNRFWQTAICPKCKVPIDSTRIRRIVAMLGSLVTTDQETSQSAAPSEYKMRTESNHAAEESTDRDAHRETESAVWRDRMLRILKLMKSKDMPWLEDFKEEDSSSFEIKTAYSQYAHKTWLKYEQPQNKNIVRIELTHIFGCVQFDSSIAHKQAVGLLSMNIPSFRNSSAYLGTRTIDGTLYVSLNCTPIFLTKWADEDIADGLLIYLGDIATGLMFEPPAPIKQFGGDR
jgi:hypothetical protein